jgi:RES domain-containing protein
MLDAAELKKALDGISPTPYSERNVFRCVELSALIADGSRKIQPLYDLGPRQSGQRYTPVGGPRCLYVSEHHGTSYIEATGMFTSLAAVAQQHAPAEVTLSFRVSLAAVLDVTEDTVQKALRTTEIELKRSWEWQVAMGQPVPTQILGQVAFDSTKYQAIRFPSARLTGEVNLVIWTERVTAPSFVECTDPNYYQRIPEQK